MLIVDGNENEILARDISPTGMAFFGSGKWSIGDMVTVEVAPFGQAPMRVQAKIVRTNEENGRTIFAAQFLSFPLLYQEKLHTLIRSAIFKDQIENYAKQSTLTVKLTSGQLATRLLWTFLTAVSVFGFYQFLIR